MSETLIYLMIFALFMFFMHRGHGGMGGCGGHAHQGHEYKPDAAEKSSQQPDAAQAHHH